MLKNSLSALLLLSLLIMTAVGCADNSVSTGSAEHNVALTLGDLPAAPKGTHYALWLSYPKNGARGKRPDVLHGTVEHKMISRFEVQNGKALFIDDTSNLESRFGALRLVVNALVSIEKDTAIGEEPQFTLFSGEITGSINEGRSILAMNGHYAWSSDIDQTQGYFLLASGEPVPAYRSSVYLMRGTSSSDLTSGLSNLPKAPEGSGYSMWAYTTEGDTVLLGHFRNAVGADDLGQDEFQFPGGRVMTGGVPIDLTKGSASIAVTLWSAGLNIDSWLRKNLTLLAGDVPSSLSPLTAAPLARKDLSRFRASITIHR